MSATQSEAIKYSENDSEILEESKQNNSEIDINPTFKELHFEKENAQPQPSKEFTRLPTQQQENISI